MTQATPGGGPDAGPERAALLVVDVQRDFCDPSVSRMAIDEATVDAIEEAVATIVRLTDAARDLGVTIVWVRLERRPDNQWPASDWLFDRSQDGWTPCRVGTEGADWFRVKPLDDDLIITKPRHSAFMGTDLEARLRSRGITSVAVCGVATDCCVEGTVRDAYQLDLPPIVVADASAAHDAARHEGALATMAAHFAVVASSDELLSHWTSGAEGSAESLIKGFRAPKTVD